MNFRGVTPRVFALAALARFRSAEGAMREVNALARQIGGPSLSWLRAVVIDVTYLSTVRGAPEPVRYSAPTDGV